MVLEAGEVMLTPLATLKRHHVRTNRCPLIDYPKKTPATNQSEDIPRNAENQIGCQRDEKYGKRFLSTHFTGMTITIRLTRHTLSHKTDSRYPHPAPSLPSLE